MAGLISTQYSHRKVGRFDHKKRHRKGKKWKSPVREIRELDKYNASVRGYPTTAFEFCQAIYESQSGLRGILLLRDGTSPMYWTDYVKNFGFSFCFKGSPPLPMTFEEDSSWEVLLNNYDPNDSFLITLPVCESEGVWHELHLIVTNGEEDRFDVTKGEVVSQTSIVLPKPLTEYSDEELGQFCFSYEED